MYSSVWQCLIGCTAQTWPWVSSQSLFALQWSGHLVPVPLTMPEAQSPQYLSRLIRTERYLRAASKMLRFLFCKIKSWFEILSNVGAMVVQHIRCWTIIAPTLVNDTYFQGWFVRAVHRVQKTVRLSRWRDLWWIALQARTEARTNPNHSRTRGRNIPLFIFIRTRPSYSRPARNHPGPRCRSAGQLSGIILIL